MNALDLDDPRARERLDVQGMLRELANFPEQCRRALELGAKWTPSLPRPGFIRILVLGMGGSGIVGDLLRVLLSVPVHVHRGYAPPAFLLDEKTLVIAISYSGNTEETLAGVEAALRQGLRPLCITSGGALGELAARHGLPLLEIPKGLQPRAALGYLLLPLLRLFARWGPFPEAEFEGLVEALSRVAQNCAPEVPEAENEAKRLARWLHGKLPLIYGSEGALEVAAFRWKTQINENAKQHAFWNAIPELCHNEIVGYTLDHPCPLGVVLLSGTGEGERNRLRREILAELLQERAVPFIVVSPPASGGRLRELLGLIYLGDWVSVYLALLNGVDPTPVAAIEEFKRRMRSIQRRS